MADLRGTAGSVTYAGTEASGGNLIVGDIVLWTMSTRQEKTRVTRPGYAMHRYSYGPLEAEGILRLVVTDTTGVAMPLPLCISATLVLLEKTGVAYTLKASLYSLNKLGVDSANGSQQWAEYRWTADATASGDTIVPS